MRISTPARKTRSARKTRVFLLAGIFAAGLAAAPAMAQIATGSGQPLLPDPVPGRGADYPPSAATATTAYGGPPLLVPARPCTEYNPCAMASSAPRVPAGPLVGALDRAATAAEKTKTRRMASSGMGPQAR